MLNHRSLSNQRGQVAIFIALMFNVLFVFFAMVVNVGMLVHHKINLQNSADLSAYYGAQKQADMLNGIAHMNYQIRQSWKLLAWRYRVLGTVTYPGHPADRNDDAEDAFFPLAGQMTEPVFCAVGFNPWRLDPKLEAALKRENACQRVDGVPVPAIAVPKVVAGFIEFNKVIRDKAIELQKLATERGRFLGMANWFTLARFFFAYRQDQANRKRIMYALAKNLSESTQDFKDGDNDSVKEGMEKTLRKNLTPENSASMTEFKVYNSLAHSSCRGAPNETQPPRWLSEIKMQPTLLYLDFDCTTCNNLSWGGSMIPMVKELHQAPIHFDEFASEPRFSWLLEQVQLDRPNYGFHHSSLGVEKDPWCAAYVGVTVKTQPSLPFSPVPVTLTARAFAKPFGGRIGPWYEKQWPRGSPRSTGGGKIDPLIGPRLTNSGDLTDDSDRTRLPNYSRFVGDKLGMNSKRVVASMQPSLKQEAIYYRFYEDLWKLLDNKEDSPAGDVLAWDAETNQAPEGRIRDFEVAALIPDLFDITYYSIEPDYYNNYFNRLKRGLNLRNVRLRSDLGAREDVGTLTKFTVMSQLATAHSTSKPTFDFSNALPYVVKNWKHVLTSWSGNDNINYSVERDVFGRCDVEAKPDVPIPGNCVSGGRTGYSVKLVSSETLGEGTPLELGGQGGGSGPILNPPPEEDQW